jgi:hypothetical protein
MHGCLYPLAQRLAAERLGWVDHEQGDRLQAGICKTLGEELDLPLVDACVEQHDGGANRLHLLERLAAVAGDRDVAGVVETGADQLERRRIMVDDQH